MSVCEILNQFTHTNFTLIVIDAGTDYEYYNGPADEVYNDTVCDMPVVAIEPPKAAGEVILYIDMDEFEDTEIEEFIIEDEQFG